MSSSGPATCSRSRSRRPRRATTSRCKAQQAFRYAPFFHAMLDAGVSLPPSVFEAWFVTAAHDDAAIDRILARPACRGEGRRDREGLAADDSQIAVFAQRLPVRSSRWAPGAPGILRGSIPRLPPSPAMARPNSVRSTIGKRCERREVRLVRGAFRCLRREVRTGVERIERGVAGQAAAHPTTPRAGIRCRSRPPSSCIR